MTVRVPRDVTYLQQAPAGFDPDSYRLRMAMPQSEYPA